MGISLKADTSPKQIDKTQKMPFSQIYVAQRPPELR